MKSGRYYLPEAPPLSEKGKTSGLINSLVTMVSLYSCGATYQCCYTELPMLRIGSPSIDDFSPMKIQYWDNSILYMKNGYPVGVKIPTEVEIDWLLNPLEEEKTIVEQAMSNEMNKVWDTLIVSNPTCYINLGLYYDGHLDSDNMLP